MTDLAYGSFNSPQAFIDSVVALNPNVAAFDCDGTLWFGAFDGNAESLCLGGRRCQWRRRDGWRRYRGVYRIPDRWRFAQPGILCGRS